MAPTPHRPPSTAARTTRTQALAALQDPALLALMSPALAALARRGELRHYARQTLLIQEGDVGDTLYIVLVGQLRAYSVNHANAREITYGVYGPGEYVGELSLDGGARAANVQTLEPSWCSVIRRATLLQHVQEHPEFALELLAKVIRRARNATLSARQLALNDVYGRLKQLLESMAERDEEGQLVVRQRLTQQDIAHRIGCTREMVTRVMRDLQPNYLRVTPQGWVLVNPLPAKW